MHLKKKKQNLASKEDEKEGLGAIGNGGKPCSWRELKREDMQWSATTNRTTQAKSRGQLASYNFLFKLADAISSSVRSSLCNPAPQETCSNCLDFHLVQRHSVITVALNCHRIMSGSSRYKQKNKENKKQKNLAFKTLSPLPLFQMNLFIASGSISDYMTELTHVHWPVLQVPFFQLDRSPEKNIEAKIMKGT